MVKVDDEDSAELMVKVYEVDLMRWTWHAQISTVYNQKMRVYRLKEMIKVQLMLEDKDIYIFISDHKLQALNM